MSYRVHKAKNFATMLKKTPSSVINQLMLCTRPDCSRVELTAEHLLFLSCPKWKAERQHLLDKFVNVLNVF